MDETKSIFMSKTFWGAMLALAGGILHLFGVDFPEEEQANIAEQIVGAAPYVMELVGAILAVVGRMTATKQATVTGEPRVDVPMGGGLNAHWLATLGAAGLALLLMGGLAGCEKNPVTGQNEFDAVTALELLSLAGAIAQIAAGDDTPPEIIDFASTGVEDGIVQFCGLSPWDKDTVRRQLDARDPTIRPYLVERYGGDNGDVCDPLPADP